METGEIKVVKIETISDYLKAQIVFFKRSKEIVESNISIELDIIERLVLSSRQYGATDCGHNLAARAIKMQELETKLYEIESQIRRYETDLDMCKAQ